MEQKEMEKRVQERLEQLKASREQHQQQLTAYQQALPQLTAQINAETGAIVELEALLHPEPAPAKAAE